MNQNPGKSTADFYREVGTNWFPPHLTRLDGYESTSPCDLAELDRNVAYSRSTGLPIFQPEGPKDRPIMILSGGPSLNDHAEEILAFNGDVMAIAQTHQWCYKHAIPFNYAVFSDPREYCTQYIEQVDPAARYLIASHCHPKFVDKLKHLPFAELVHVGQAETEYRFKNDDGTTQHYVAVAAHTSLIGIKCAILMGYTDIHLVGMDSCYMNGQRHSYEKPKQVDRKLMDVHVRGRAFLCDSSMAVQAMEMKEFVRRFGDQFQLTIYGDGLIANMFNNQEETK
jgi:hypothetical protein